MTPIRWPKTLLCLGIILCANSAFSQLTFETYSDTEPKPDGVVTVAKREGNAVYIAGVSTTTCAVAPFVAKMSLDNGETLWSTTSDASTASDYTEVATRWGYYTIDKIGIIDDAVYAYLPNRIYGLPCELWKINKQTGKILWRIDATNIRNSNNADKNYFLKLSSTQILVAQQYVINTTTGAIENKFVPANYVYVLGNSADGDLYMMSGTNILKVHNLDWATATTVAVVPSGGGTGRVVELDGGKKLLRVAGDISLIDLTTKTVLWNVVGYEGWPNAGDFVVKGNYLYVNWLPTYLGDGSELRPPHTSKIDLVTGERLWKASPKYSTTTRPGSTNIGSGTALALDVDDAGDVYTTGYANATDDYGDFGVMKLSGTDGTVLWDELITDHDYFDKYGDGRGIFVYNNKPYAVGNVVATSSQFLPGDSSGPGPYGNNITIAALNATTGAQEGRFMFYGSKIESSDPGVATRYQSYLITAQTQGRRVLLTKYDKNMKPVWSKNLWHPASYLVKAQRIAVDNAGNIAVLAAGQSTARGVIFVLDANGKMLQTIDEPKPTLHDDLISDGDYFYAFFLLDSQSYLHKINATTDQRTELTQSMWPAVGSKTGVTKENYLANASGNQLLVVGEYFKGYLVDKTTLKATLLGELLDPYNVFSQASSRNVVVRNDTAYVSGYVRTDAFRPMFAYSLLAKKLVWYMPENAGDYRGNFYNKFIMGSDGFLYGIGISQYQGILVSKIDRRTGTIVWSYAGSYANDIEGSDIYYDSLRNQVVITGYRDVSGVNRPVFAAFNAATGSLQTLSIDNTRTGTGLLIAQAGNGDILLGGTLTSSTSCATTGYKATYATSALTPPSVDASDGKEDNVTVTWTPEGLSPYFRVYRGTTNNASQAQPLTGWINQTSYIDATAAVATGYYYFIAAAVDGTGKGASPRSAGSYGYRGLARPKLESVTVASPSSVVVRWQAAPPANAYKVYRSETDNAAQASALSGWITDLSFNDVTTVAGKTYYYFLQAATDAAGSFASALSASLNATQPTVTPPPVDPPAEPPVTPPVVGVEDPLTGTFELYPNPATATVAVRYGSSYQGMVVVTVFNATGRTVGEWHIDKARYNFEQSINIDAMSPGAYVVTIAEGADIRRVRFMKR